MVGKMIFKNSVGIGESFQTQIYLENVASIQPGTSSVEFARSSGSLRTPRRSWTAKARAAGRGADRRQVRAPLPAPARPTAGAPLCSGQYYNPTNSDIEIMQDISKWQ